MTLVYSVNPNDPPAYKRNLTNGFCWYGESYALEGVSREGLALPEESQN